MKFLKEPLIYLSGLWVILLLAIGSWWATFISRLNGQLEGLHQQLGLQSPPAVERMLLWEGGTFFLLLILLTVSIVFLYLKDQQKSRSLQTFYSSMTHELKTPLASVRLQAEVIDEKLKEKDYTRLENITSRLIQDSQTLENHMDKILQLGRLEKGGNLNLTEIDLAPFIKRVQNKWNPGIELEIEGASFPILADEFALELIIRNLFENTICHTNSSNVLIALEPNTKRIYYRDQGQFNGQQSKVGHLFYKHNSPKGSGIGLYLCKILMLKMKGSFKINSSQTFEVVLSFAKEKGDK